MGKVGHHFRKPQRSFNSTLKHLNSSANSHLNHWLDLDPLLVNFFNSSWVITPRNYNLMLVNFSMGLSGLYQLSRKV